VQKRDHYMQLAKQHGTDLLIVIDSDEYIPKGWDDWERFYFEIINVVMRRHRMTYNMFNMHLHDVGMSQDQWTTKPRLLFRPWELEYWYNHHTFRRRAEYYRTNPSPVYPVDIVEGVRIWHDHSLRTQKHMEGRKLYQDWILSGGECI
jgi:hypothetical protein